MNNTGTFLLLLILCMFHASGFTQSTAIEIARQKIYQSNTPEEKLQHLIAIGKLKNALHGDSIYRYALWAKELAAQLHDDKSLAWASYHLLAADLARGKTDSVIYHIDSAAIFKDIKKIDAVLYYRVQFLKANALNRIDNRTAALELQLRLLNEAENEGNVNAQLFALNYTGATLLNTNQPVAAKQAWLKGLAIVKAQPATENNEIATYIRSNLALYYFNIYYATHAKEAADSFLNTIQQCVNLSRENEYLGLLASSLSLRGNFNGIQQQFAAGEKDFKEAIAIRNKIGDPLYIVNDLAGLSGFYLNQQQYAACVGAAMEGIRIANSNKVKGTEVASLYLLMGSAYKALKDYPQYSKTLEQYITVADSSNRVNAAEKIAEIQTRYETQKKETLIARQALQLLQRKFMIYGGSILAGLMFLFLGYRFNKYKQQQKIKLATLIEEKKRQHDLAVKEAEESERKRIAAELHDNLGVQANAILHNSILLKNQQTYNIHVITDLQETAKEMLLNLRETLWAMRTTDVTAISLWLRIINFMKQMGRHYTTTNFIVEGEAPEAMVLPSTKALNIVLVVQETVNNAVKHANAACITVISACGSNGWQITIRDNGDGFDEAAAAMKTDSNGLKNIRERATAVQFKYQVETGVGKGTAASILIDG